MAKTLFPPGPLVGKSYYVGDVNDPPVRIVGIVKDVRSASLDENDDAVDYIPYTQRKDYINDFSVRYTGDFHAIADAV